MVGFVRLIFAQLWVTKNAEKKTSILAAEHFVVSGMIRPSLMITWGWLMASWSIAYGYVIPTTSTARSVLMTSKKETVTNKLDGRDVTSTWLLMVQTSVPDEVSTWPQVTPPSSWSERTKNSSNTVYDHGSNSRESNINEQHEGMENGEELSDVDTRVLRAMLQDAKLDLQTEDDIRKLLERGTRKTIPKAPESKAESSTSTSASSTTESEFASSAFKLFTDTKLWKAMKTKANDVLESVTIWVSNKVEQDVKVLAALGLYAWDRAVQDVSRALPASSAVRSTNPVTTSMFLFSNTSSADTVDSSITTGGISVMDRSVRDELRKPTDELKTVAGEVWGILSGRQRTSTGRGLRTAAPSGFSNAAERQRRAYQQSTQQSQSSRVLNPQQQSQLGGGSGFSLRGVTKLAGGVIDTTWQLKGELRSELNQPGYKTKPLLRAIEAGTENLFLKAAATLSLKGQGSNSGNNNNSNNNLYRLPGMRESDSDRTTTGGRFGLGVASTSFVDVDTGMVTCNDVNGPRYTAVNEYDTTASNLPQNTAQSPQYFMQMFDMRFRMNQEHSGPAGNTLENERISMGDSVMSVPNYPSTLPRFANERALIMAFMAERERISGNVRRCIEEPSQTWLLDVTNDISDGDLRYVVTKLVLLRNEIIEQVMIDDFATPFIQLQCLRDIKSRCDELSNMDTESIPGFVVDKLRQELYGTNDDALFSQLDLIDDPFMLLSSYHESSNNNVGVEIRTTFSGDSVNDLQLVEPVVRRDNSKHANPRKWFATIAETAYDEQLRAYNAANVPNKESSEPLVDDGYRRIVRGIEVVPDEEFELKVGSMKTAKAVANTSAEEETMKADNIAANLALRTLDIAFFVLEKLVVTGIPYALIVSMTALQRLETLNQKGKGRNGWMRFAKLADAKGRY